MSESSDLPVTEGVVKPAPTGATAGAMLRAAREHAGMSLDVLSQVLKVPVPKLEALEADRYGELPGLAFVRGLAVSMCRQLGIDSRPVLEALPTSAGTPEGGKRLESVTRGLAEPYREPNGRSIILPAATSVFRKGVLVPVVFLAFALGLWLIPGVPDLRSYLPGLDAEAPADSSGAPVPSQAVQDLPPVSLTPAPGAEAAASAAVAPLVGASAVSAAPLVPAAVVDTVFSHPREVEEGASAVPDTPPDGVIVVRTTGDSWVEARDASGKVLMSRMVSVGEEVGVNGELPIRLKVGNAGAARVTFRGQPYDLRPYTNGSVAKVELK